MPSRRKRQRKLICGGHSLGGPLTAALASWDFDGDPETDADAGYNQCAAFVGLDTTVSMEGGEGEGGPGVALITGAASQSGASPFVNAPPLTPETLLAPALIGVTAFQKPDEETITTQLIPSDPEWELTQRLLFSRNAEDFATGSPSVRDFRVTNASALAAIFDDNSSPISIFRASIGMYTGGPLVDKSFPAPDPTLAAPDEPHGPLYHWQNYSRVGANGAELELNDEGDPYTSRDSEVTDVRQLGRSHLPVPGQLHRVVLPDAARHRLRRDDGGRPQRRPREPALGRPVDEADPAGAGGRQRRQRRGDGRGPDADRREAERQGPEPRGDPARLQPPRRGDGRLEAERRPQGGLEQGARPLHAEGRAGGS